MNLAFAQVRARYQFDVVAGVVLPDHLHLVWSQPEADFDFGKRWSLIKRITGNLLGDESATATAEKPFSRASRRERGLWQRRFWEHCIRDQDDLQAHVDYIHYNPVRHGLVSMAVDWPYSTLHRFIRRGWVSQDWAVGTSDRICAGE